MSIVKMKHIHLYGVRTQKDDVLRELMLLGCVEINEPERLMRDEDAASRLTRETSSPEAARNQQAKLLRAISVLDRYSPAKGKLLSGKPRVGQRDFLDEAKLHSAMEKADALDDFEAEIKRLEAEISESRNSIEMLTPWKTLDEPVEEMGTRETDIMYLTAPAGIQFGEIESAAAHEAQEAELFLISTGKEMHYMQLVAYKDKTEQALQAMRPFGVSTVPLSAQKGTPSGSIEALKKRISADEDSIRQWQHKITELANERQELKLCADLLTTKVARAEAAGKLASTDSVFVLEGWVSAPDIPTMEQALAAYDVTYEYEEPEPEEYPTVPVKLSNNKVTSSMNMVTNMYSLPEYGTLDPNPLMAPFFIVFYGLMMSDMGYGLLMIAAALVAMKKIKPVEGTLDFCRLLLYCGITTTIFGACTGGFFGDAPYQVALLLNPNTTFAGLPKLFDPLNDSLYVLVAALAIGVIQIFTGMLINAVQKCRHGKWYDALMDEGSWWLLYIGIGLGAAGITWYVAIAGVAAVVLTQGRAKKGIFGKLFGGIASLYDITSFAGDILSYSRLMALMLAGSVIAQVFNMIASLFGNIFMFIIIFIIGHTLNFGLNLLSCFVHDLRLQCLEYFGRFYTDGGKPFEPLRIKTKFVQVTK